MTTNDRLIFEAAGGIEKANRILQKVWKGQSIRHKTAILLLTQLRRVCAAAQELERRAAGCPPAKEG